MLFFSSILCADTCTPTASPSNVSDITSLTVSNAYFDDVFATKNIEYDSSAEFPSDWDFDTIMHAKYDENLTAGNVNFEFDKIKGSYLLIKRRIKDTLHWITLQAYNINELEDLDIRFIDYTATSDTEYEYAAVPMVDGIEGNYYTVTITPSTSKLVIVDQTAVWATIVTNGFADSMRNSPPGIIEIMNDKYPTIIHNGAANYDTVTVTAGWFPTSEDNPCEMLIGEEYNGWVARYAKQFMDFLTNRQIKILKNVDGRIWLCYVTVLPTNSARDVYYDREITFGVTEIADIEDERTLYDAGLIDASERWWNT